jgi:hypothetical protein
MPEMKTYFELGMDSISVKQFTSESGNLAGGILVYKHRNTGFTLDNYAGGKGLNNHSSRLEVTLRVKGMVVPNLTYSR